MTAQSDGCFEAGKRTRDRLARKLRSITGRDATEVRVTRVRWSESLRWVALVLVADADAQNGRREIPLADGSQHRQIAVLIHEAFPQANWSIAQDYDVADGTLREHLVHVPAYLGGEQR
ncbi:hypothetical protein [Streptomyces sp. NPDC056160]|uniref:hypothetical protein n=1 Tax=Streptomyces sp. NPDC056160 TaxID=3345731 RepID=UPI0035DB169D